MVPAAGAAFATARLAVRGAAADGFAAPFNWIAFGPGERALGDGLSFFGVSLAGTSVKAEGRIAFGIDAVTADVMAVLARRDLLRRS